MRTKKKRNHKKKTKKKKKRRRRRRRKEKEIVPGVDFNCSISCLCGYDVSKCSFSHP